MSGNPIRKKNIEHFYLQMESLLTTFSLTFAIYYRLCRGFNVSMKKVDYGGSILGVTWVISVSKGKRFISEVLWKGEFKEK